MAGVLIPNTRRRVQTKVGNKTVTGFETIGLITGGTLVRTVDGGEREHQIDGSKFATAHVQVEPGRVIRVVGYGPNADTLLAMEPGKPFNADLYPMPRNWYKLAGFHEEAPATEPIGPAAA